MEHEVVVEIDAPPEEVWDVLVDIEHWPEWTASVKSAQRIDGDGDGAADVLKVGSTVRLKQPRLPAMVWRVTEVEPGRSFDWTASSLGVTTEAGHRIEAMGDDRNRSRVTLSIAQTGPLAGLVGWLLGSQTRRYVELEAEGLKRRAEGDSRT